MWPFKRTEKPKRSVNVRKAKVKVRVNDGRSFDLTFEGRYLGIHPLGRGEDWIQDSSESFYAWQERSQKRGMAWVQDGLYVPLCNIKDVQVSYEDFDVEVSD